MPTLPTDKIIKPNQPRRGRGLVVLIAFAGLIWSLPRPQLQDVVVDETGESGSTKPTGRLAFRTAELLGELSGKGTLADETELSGPCFADDGQTLYFSRARPGQKADIVRSMLGENGWAKPESVRDLNSVDDDRRMTLSADGRIAILASNRSGGHGGFDLYESTHDGKRWSKPRNAGATLNTDAAEFDPALTPDGLTMYFVRVAPGEKADLFMTRREALDAVWSTPQPIPLVNAADFHERSPAVSPDGSWLLFASNRGARSSEPGPFALFRAAIHDGKVGTAERLRDGIASEVDDLDATFSPDGRSLAFVSKRDGPKQIFLSRGQPVVLRLAISTAHLETFGRGRWAVPGVGLVILFLAWCWSRQALSAAVIVVPETRPATAAPKRSEPLKNPLDNWTITKPTEAPPTPKPLNPLVASAKLSSEPKPTTVVPLKPEPVRPRRRRLAVAALVISAGLLFAFRTKIWDSSPSSTSPLPAFDADSLAVVTFLDLDHSRIVELLKFDRFDTLSKTAPQPIAPPSDAVALRLAARWPVDQTTVRQRSEVARLADIDPSQSNSKRLAVIARQPLQAELTRPTARPAEEAKLIAVVAELEKPHVVAPTSTTQQTFVPSSAERTAVSSAVANQAALRAPTSRATPIAPAIAVVGDVSQSATLARNGAANRGVTPSNLVEPEALTALSAIIPTESPLPPQSISILRSEPAPIGRPNSPNEVPARPLLPPSRTVSNVAGSAVSAPDAKGLSTQLPTKSPAVPKAAPLIEEIVLPATSATPVTDNSLAASTPPRIESLGPQPNLPPTFSTPNTARIDLTTLRSPSRIESTESSARVLENRTILTITRRDSPLPLIAAAAAQGATEPMPGSPAILLTSSTMLVELLASANLNPLPRAESSAPTPTVATSSASEFTGWLSRVPSLTTLSGARSESEPRSATPATAIPRQSRTVAPAEFVGAP
ncbi:MAG: hypothetical protein FJ302_06355 [Planctomycetes bacterium]|nr:hypothetical protein [Planctomycetota bacterium]